MLLILSSLRLMRQSAVVTTITFLCYLLSIIINTEITYVTSQSEVSANFKVDHSIIEAVQQDFESRNLKCKVIYNLANIGYTDILFLYYKYSIIVVDDIPTVMDYNGGGELTGGRMPNKANELLLDENIAKNNQLKLGDYFAAGELSGGMGDVGKVQLVGVYSPNTNDWRNGFVPRDPNKGYADYQDTISLSVWMPMHEFDNFILNVQDELIRPYPEGSIVPLSNFGSAKQIETNRQGFVSIVILLFFFVSLISIFCLYHTSCIHLYRRIYEFQVLIALGYSKRNIIFCMYKEYIFINMGGWALGFLLGTLATFILNMLFWIPNGTPAVSFSPYGATLSFVCATLLCVFTAIPVGKMVGNRHMVPGQ